MRKITEHSVELIGLDYPDYFPGRGVATTKWDHVAIGVADTAYDALQDALEQLATGDWEVEDNRFAEDEQEALADVTQPDHDEQQFYVAVYVK